MDTRSDSATSIARKSDFRPDIAALRALAVTVVVLFHFGVPGVPGGFVGVDVFFVISGFLMTSILTGAAARGRLDIVGFYLGRVRRIVPALVVVTLCTLVAGYALLLPDDYVQLAWDAVGADTFTINAIFARTNDYFAQSTDQSWFLHCWSLAVEIQFYLVIPFVVLVSKRFAPRTGVRIGLLGVGALSLVASCVQTHMDSTAAFYLPSTRAWEFAAGGLVSTLRPIEALNRSVACFGIAMILAAVAVYDASLAYPGLWPLAPVVGTALVIWANIDSRLLSAGPVQYLGAISYSVYLWHWPVLLACRLLLPSGGPLAFGVEVVASVLLSALTFRFVETPFRSHRRKLGFRPISVAVTGLAMVVLASGIVVRREGFPDRVPADIRRIVKMSPPMEDWRYKRCFLRTDQDVSDLAPECLSKQGDSRPKIMLWGDSTVADLYPGLKAQPWADNFSIEQITAGSCAHYGTAVAATLPYCSALQKFALSQILANPPAYVIISMAQTNFSDDPASALMAGKRVDPMVDLIGRLKAAGVAHVIVGGPMPFWPAGMPATFARQSFKSNLIEMSLRLPNAKRIRAWDVAMRTAATKAGAEYLSYIEGLCAGDHCASLVPHAANPTLMQFDTLHFTTRGAAYVVNHLLAPLLDQKVGSQDDRGDYSFDPLQVDDGGKPELLTPPSEMPQHYALNVGRSFTIDLRIHFAGTQIPYATILQNYDSQQRGFSIEYTAINRAALFVKMEDGTLYGSQFDIKPDVDHHFKLQVRDGHPSLALDDTVIAHTEDGHMAQSVGELWAGGSGLFQGRHLEGKLLGFSVSGDATRQ